MSYDPNKTPKENGKSLFHQNMTLTKEFLVINESVDDCERIYHGEEETGKRMECYKGVSEEYTEAVKEKKTKKV